MEEKTYDLTRPRHDFSLICFAFVVLLVVEVLAQLVMIALEPLIFGQAELPGWWLWVSSSVPLYAVAVPVYGLLLKLGLPAQAPQRQKLSRKEFLTLLPICCCLMYGGNLVGTWLSLLLSNGQAVNAVAELAMDQSPLKILVMVILAPLMEELICRKLLLDRIGRYGEKLAVLVSGLVFGLLHQNLYQFFYAFALGSVFAYVYLRTGKLRYPVIFHGIINFMGSVLAPFVTSLVDMETIEKLAAGEQLNVELLASVLSGYLVLILYALILMGLSILGLILLLIKFPTTLWKPATDQLPRKLGLKAFFLNAGMIVYTLICLAMMVVSLLP